MQNKNTKTNIEKICIAPEYEDMVRGLNLTPEQDKELKKLYSRATLRVNPWGFIFAGALSADLVAFWYVMIKCLETGDIHNANWFFGVLGAQIVAALACGARMEVANNKLQKRIDEIRQEYLRQISR